MEEKHIVLLNVTVATLLAGKSASIAREYDSYIGYILGTGTNTCYIESTKNILKLKSSDPARSQIINIETGKFDKVTQTDLDILFDNSTMNPGDYRFEKMIAGGYLGGICLTTLKSAAREGVFTQNAAIAILALDDLTSEEANTYVTNPTAICGSLFQCMKDKTDAENCIKIIDSIIDRAAKLVAANLAAVILKTEKGKSAEKPILITIEGTTFYKMHNLCKYFESYLEEYLQGDRKRYYEFTEVQQSSLVGAALAALIN
jgi:hexokinase